MASKSIFQFLEGAEEGTIVLIYVLNTFYAEEFPSFYDTIKFKSNVHNYSSIISLTYLSNKDNSKAFLHLLCFYTRMVGHTNQSRRQKTF